MARFESNLPEDLIKTFIDLEENTTNMMKEMTSAGAKTVYNNVIKNMKKSFKSSKRLEKCLKITTAYKTYSDDAVNTKVGFYGYLDGDKQKPAPLIAVAREKGTSRGEAKKLFMRKSFVKKEIELSMNKVQESYIKGE